MKWLSVDRTKIQNTKAYLITAVTNNCLNHLNTLRKKKEEYWDSGKLSQFITKFKETDFGHLDLESELTSAFKVLHAKLEPLERAAYVLKEAFDFDYQAIQEVLNKKADHCRQLLSRAKKKLAEESISFHFDFSTKENLIENFKKACEGRASHYILELKSDISAKLAKKV